MERRELVVVVDEDRAVRDSLKFQLELEGMRVRTCSDLAELMAMEELVQAQCIVMEESPPKRDSLQLVQALKSRRIAVPIILVASNATPQLRQRAGKAGIQQVLSKPVLGGELVEAIRKNIAGSIG